MAGVSFSKFTPKESKRYYTNTGLQTSEIQEINTSAEIVPN